MASSSDPLRKCVVASGYYAKVDEEKECCCEVKDERVATMASCIFNLSNTIVGSGILGLPKAFADVGLGLGTFFIFLFGSLAVFGLHLLAVSSVIAGDPRASFRSVAARAAPKFTALIDASVAIKCFGVATSYLIVIGDTIPRVLRGSRRLWILAATASVAPLSMLGKLDALKVTSAVSLGFVLWLALVVFAYRFKVDEEAVGEKRVVAEFDLNAARYLTTFVFAFTCHQNIFAIVNEIRKPSQRRVDAVILISVGIALSLYLCVAVSGYDTFGDNVEGDILDNYPATFAISLTRFCIALLVLFSYPLQLFPSRTCALALLAHLRRKTPQDEDDAATALRSRVVATAVFLLASSAIAVSVRSLDTVLSVVGATGSTIVSYILPGGIYYRLAPPGPMRTLALGVFILGICIIPGPRALEKVAVFLGFLEDV
ncbi:hypothetical protein CTAYLR_003231 [Chrysophaeum taylorii]|uniref:Amino acid transporter transmembrane domain-containing protein n=1 Tax=Chrysophaeum taylorii TaxID=2483200 RepID=A0AAD7UB99_9STRA|nr:hypothetical protein CTAYLR_003231 [Chrysophaeum taylorii]